MDEVTNNGGTILVNILEQCQTAEASGYHQSIDILKFIKEAVILLSEVLVKRNLIDFLLVVCRVRKPFSNLSIVGEHQHSRGVLVETSDREHPGSTLLEKFHHCLLGVRIGSRGHESLRLVHHDVDLLLTVKPLSVEADIVLGDVDFCSEFSDDVSVDCHTAREDEVVGLAP